MKPIENSQNIFQEKKKKRESKINLDIINLLTEDEIKITINIFLNSIRLLKEKILNFEISKVFKSLQNIMTIIYSITNLSNKIFNAIKLYKISKIFLEEKFSDELINFLFVLNDRDLFSEIDNHFGKIDEISINVKSIIFRCLYNCIILIKSLRESEENSMVNS